MSDWFNVTVNIRVEADDQDDANRKVQALIASSLGMPGSEKFDGETVTVDRVWIDARV